MIVLRFEGNPSNGDMEIFKTYDLQYSKSKSLSGGEALVNVLIPLVPVVVVQLTNIIRDLIKDKAKVSIKINDSIEIKNIKIEDIDEVVNKIKRISKIEKK